MVFAVCMQTDSLPLVDMSYSPSPFVTHLAECGLLLKGCHVFSSLHSFTPLPRELR